MRYFSTLALISFLSCNLYADSFSLESIQSIVCEDAASTSELKVYFTIDNEAAHKYVRRPNDLPYDYGNLQSPFKNFSSGVLELKNAPDNESGKIVLGDNWDPKDPVVLTLTPTQVSLKYSGVLTGVIETSTGWGPLAPHALLCVVK